MKKLNKKDRGIIKFALDCLIEDWERAEQTAEAFELKEAKKTAELVLKLAKAAKTKMEI